MHTKAPRSKQSNPTEDEHHKKGNHDTVLDSANMPRYAKTLEFLKSHSDECLSGRDLSDVLGTSRVAIWKHVRALQNLGYEIKPVQRTGYRFVGSCDKPYPWEIGVQTDAAIIAKRILYYDTTSSTQDVAASLGRDGSNDGTVVIAAEQTAARGRAGKKWMSPRGGIWMSVVLQPPHMDASRATLLPIGVGAAVARAIRSTCGLHTELRWPNDITVRGEKIAGIITEADMEIERIQNIRVGIGVNFDLDPSKIQKEFSGMDGFYGAASVIPEMKKAGHAGPKASKVKLVNDIISNTERTYRMLLEGNTKAIISEWAEIPSTIGRRLSATIDDIKITGVATGITDSGMLAVRRDDHSGQKETVHIMTGGIRYM